MYLSCWCSLEWVTRTECLQSILSVSRPTSQSHHVVATDSSSPCAKASALTFGLPGSQPQRLSTATNKMITGDNRMTFSQSDVLYAASSDAQMVTATWKVGQKVVCDRHASHAGDCYIRSIDVHGSVTIFCPATNTIICGQRRNLEQLGWQIEV